MDGEGVRVLFGWLFGRKIQKTDENACFGMNGEVSCVTPIPCSAEYRCTMTVFVHSLSNVSASDRKEYASGEDTPREYNEIASFLSIQDQTKPLRSSTPSKHTHPHTQPHTPPAPLVSYPPTPWPPHLEPRLHPPLPAANTHPRTPKPCDSSPT